MTLHHDQVTRINQWLANHVQERCPACGLRNWWQIHDGFHGVSSVSLDTLSLEEGLELVATSCKRCGYTAFFLATRMSLGPRPPTADSP
jgi:predicted nucleic-acid-binding Zn-ribbon protein